MENLASSCSQFDNGRSISQRNAFSAIWNVQKIGQMLPSFLHLNREWNAEPNAPNARLSIDGTITFCGSE
jgi:predicted metal-binding membrane protein